MLHRLISTVSRPLYLLAILLWLWMLANGASLVFTGHDLLSPGEAHVGSRSAQMISGAVLIVIAMAFIKMAGLGLAYKTPRRKRPHTRKRADDVPICA